VGDSTAASKVAHDEATPRRVLLVDDNFDSARTLSQLLTRRGHEVQIATDGLEAIQVAQDFQPDVFLLDLGLPGIDGYQLARRLRADGFTSALMIAVSGYAQESDVENAHASGFDQHFAKPVDFAEILSALRPAG
jgi:CheY-like chemotaxis protein